MKINARLGHRLNSISSANYIPCVNNYNAQTFVGLQNEEKVYVREKFVPRNSAWLTIF